MAPKHYPRAIICGATLGAGLMLVAPLFADRVPVAPQFSLPVDCALGSTCRIQSYVDVDPGPGVLDFACGSATYEGHDGTDFRLPSAREAGAGVAVLAAASGTVKAMRDGMVDRLATANSRSLIAKRECGNGVVVDHGGGWETQYCHLRAGSVLVKTGEVVAAGAKLGLVGYSGLAEFAHVHFAVRKDGAVIDPFSGRERTPTCERDPALGESLWDERFRSEFRYLNGEIIGAAFAGEIPSLDTVELDGGAATPVPESPQLIFFARLINLKAGDIVRITADGPQGFSVRSASEPLDRNKATYLGYAGSKLTRERWPAGRYRGRVEILRDGRAVAERSGELMLE